MAGAHAAIGSLWPVDDESSLSLFEDFYRRYMADQPSGIALQQASIGFLRSHPSSFVWASFHSGIARFAPTCGSVSQIDLKEDTYEIPQTPFHSCSLFTPSVGVPWDGYLSSPFGSRVPQRCQGQVKSLNVTFRSERTNWTSGVKRSKSFLYFS
jgi:hypothetical protein